MLGDKTQSYRAAIAYTTLEILLFGGNFELRSPPPPPQIAMLGADGDVTGESASLCSSSNQHFIGRRAGGGHQQWKEVVYMQGKHPSTQNSAASINLSMIVGQKKY